LKIEVKKKIDVNFDCRSRPETPEHELESKCNHNFGKKLLVRCEKLLDVSGLRAIAEK